MMTRSEVAFLFLFFAAACLAFALGLHFLVGLPVVREVAVSEP